MSMRQTAKFCTDIELCWIVLANSVYNSVASHSLKYLLEFYVTEEGLNLFYLPSMTSDSGLGMALMVASQISRSE